MEKYIQKINDKLMAKNDMDKAVKAKKIYRIAGYCLLGVGLAGFVASFISFFVLFFKFHTEDAFTAWIIAVPFLLMIVAGSVCARIGDAILPELNKRQRKSKYKDENVKKEK